MYNKLHEGKWKLRNHVHQIQLRFPHGIRLLREFLGRPSAQVRANPKPAALAFATMGMIPQLPRTLNEVTRQTIIGYIMETDLLLRPARFA